MNDLRHPLSVLPAPHLSAGTRTSGIMWSVVIALVPALLWGVYVFGWQALLTVTLAVGSAVLTELAVNYFRRRLTVTDGSAFLTGLLLGLSLPPQVPAYVPIAASVFAMAVVKHAFGGLGANWMNPALAGRVFALFSFPAAMDAWRVPVTLSGSTGIADAVSGATPLAAVKAGVADLAARLGPEELAARLREAAGPAGLLASRGWPVTPFDAAVSGWFNARAGAPVRPGYFDLFFGNRAGSIGEVSVLLLLAGAIFLLVRRIIAWEIPAAFLGTFAFFSWLLGGLGFAGGPFSGDAVFHLLTGGVVFAAFYMATDSVTAPLSRAGKMIFGAGAGLLTVVIRLAGSLPEGVSLAIIFMNMFVPLMDRFLKPRIFGAQAGRKHGPV